jgi:site-specific recombinase XerC
MLETLYSTGMRRTELAGLSLFDIDRERGTVMIRQGKGKKDRMIPIGERALAWIERYPGRLLPTRTTAIGAASPSRSSAERSEHRRTSVPDAASPATSSRPSLTKSPFHAG